MSKTGSPRNRRQEASSSSVRRKRSAPGATRERPRGTVEHVTPADGNVFRDIGFPPAEAENLKVRSDLMSALQDVIAERGLTQVQAAKLFGVAQPRVSDLCRDKIDRFTIDTLINMLAHAGMRVRLKVGRPAA